VTRNRKASCPSPLLVRLLVAVFCAAILSQGGVAIATPVSDNPAARHTPIAVSTPPTLTTSAPATPLLTPSGSAPSGQAMPLGSVPSWHQVFAEDFLEDIPVGSWPGTTYGPKWDFYPDCWHDTSGIGFYYPDKVVSVSGGVLTKYLHSEQMNGLCGVTDTRALVAAIVPRLPRPMTSGRYIVRFRSDALQNFKTAWLLWPDSNLGSEGEIDFPEGELDGTISAFLHYKNNTSSSQQHVFNTTARYTAWHTASIEWVINDLVTDAGSVTFILDGQTIGTSTTRVPDTPMHWVLQTETCVAACQPDATTAGSVQIDWVVAYTRDATSTTPTATLTPAPTPTSTLTPTVAPASPAPPRITLRAQATANNGSGGNTLTVPAPGGVVPGDVLLAQVAVNTADTIITPPSGWLQIQRTQSISSIAMVSYWRIAGAAEPSGHTFTFDSSQPATGGVAAYAGVDTGAPIDASSSVYNPNSATVTFAPVTATQANDLILAMIAATGNTTITPPAGFVESYDVNDPVSASGKTIEASGSIQPVAGVTNVGTASEATNIGSNLAQLVALKAAP
jgi:hypothetical protein